MTKAMETLAQTIQQFWQGPSGRPWDGTEESCCVKLPGQADWFRRLAAHILSAQATAESQAESLTAALQFIADGYANPDVNHVDYRVKVYQVALTALSKLPSAKRHPNCPCAPAKCIYPTCTCALSSRHSKHPRGTDMSEQIELQGCEHCGKDHNLETMRMMSDCWFCEDCTADFQKHFDACSHKWSPHVDEMGDPGQYCEHCSGFVRDEDFPALFGESAQPTAPHSSHQGKTP
jgi:hypothetical protein